MEAKVTAQKVEGHWVCSRVESVSEDEEFIQTTQVRNSSREEHSTGRGYNETCGAVVRNDIVAGAVAVRVVVKEDKESATHQNNVSVTSVPESHSDCHN